MTAQPHNGRLLGLIAGDIIALLIVTWVGFLSHSQSVLTPRWLTTFLPLLISWLLLAPWFGAFDLPTATRPTAVWRFGLAAALGAPLAALLRSLWLGGMVVPVFALVLAGTSALGMLLWRLLWAFLNNRRQTTWMKQP